MSCIVCVDSGLQILVGAGGAGGYKKEVSSTAGQGGGGVATSIFTGATINASNSGISGGTCICSCFGGGPGRASTERQAYAGGSGGDPHVYTGCYCAYTRKGGTGGKVYGLANATGCAALKVYASASTSYTGYALRSIPGKSGGKQGHNNAPGGGGASMESKGPDGAGSTSDGKQGYGGAGGSGARFTLAVYKRGGKGGPGYVDIYY